MTGSPSVPPSPFENIRAGGRVRPFFLQRFVDDFCRLGYVFSFFFFFFLFAGDFFFSFLLTAGTGFILLFFSFSWGTGR